MHLIRPFVPTLEQSFQCTLRMGGSVSSVACMSLRGSRGRSSPGTAMDTILIIFPPSSCVQSSLVLPQSPVKPLQRGPELLRSHTCNVLPHFKRYKVLTGSCSEYNILPSSGFPPLAQGSYMETTVNGGRLNPLVPWIQTVLQ